MGGLFDLKSYFISEATITQSYDSKTSDPRNSDINLELKNQEYINYINLLQKRIELLESYVDNDADTFIANISGEIDSYAAATEAITTYGIAWFNSLPYSSKILRQLCERLIAVCSVYTSEINPTWIDILNDNINTATLLDNSVNIN